MAYGGSLGQSLFKNVSILVFDPDGELMPSDDCLVAIPTHAIWI